MIKILLWWYCAHPKGVNTISLAEVEIDEILTKTTKTKTARNKISCNRTTLRNTTDQYFYSVKRLVSLKKGTNLIRNKMSDSSTSTSTNGHGTLAPQVKSQEAVISGLVEAHHVQEPIKSKKEIREERKRKLAALFRKPMTYLLIITAGLVVSTGAVIFMVR